MTVLRACVTGGSRGIGRAVAATLSAAGHDVTILGRRRDTLEAAVRAGAARAFRTVDVADLDALAEIVTEGRYDLLVNNAGGAETAPFHRSGRELFRRAMALNFEATVEATRAALPHMTGRGFGRVVNVASTAGLKGYAYATAYTAAKHAVVGFTRALAVELARSGVTVNAVCPGYTDTDLVAASVEIVVARTGRSSDEARAHFAAANPMGRLVRPDEVADAVLWLTGAGASAVTGQCVAVAGGEL